MAVLTSSNWHVKQRQGEEKEQVSQEFKQI
jgi:hypothetical protein